MKRILVLSLILISFFNANATHVMGGDITWECIKDPTNPDVGKYIFKMKVYRDCMGNALTTTFKTLDVWGHPSVTQITLNFIENNDITPDGNSGVAGNACLAC